MTVKDFSHVGRLRRERDSDVEASPLVRFAQERLDERRADGYALRVADVWCHAEAGGARVMRTQGWKLHVSGAAPSAMEILRRVFDMLVDAGCTFKFAKSMDVVKTLNSAQYARGGAGKFITIYPNDDEQFRSLAAALHEATAGLAGQNILSDRPYAPGSLVHYRYGAFTGHARRGNDSDIRHFILAPDGTEVEDRRDAWFNPPPWAGSPLPEPPSTTASPTSVLLAGRYLAREAIRHANKGGVFLAVDTTTGTDVVIKQARRHVSMNEDGWEVRDGIRNEAEMLDLFAPTGITPRKITLFEQQGDLFLVEEHIEGQSLRRYATRMDESGAPGAGPSWESVAQIGEKLASLLDTVHRAGIVLRDFSPNNVMVRPDGELALVDLEFAVRVGTVTFPVGTPAYMDPDQGMDDVAADFGADLYSLGALLYLLATGTDPIFAMDEPPGRTVQQRMAEYLAGTAGENGTARLVAPLVLGLVDADPAKRWSLEAVRAFLASPAPQEPFAADGTGPRDVPDGDRLIADGLDWLAESITPESPERLWPTTCFGLESDPCNVQHGAAGVAATLLLALRLGHDDLTTPLRQACDWLVRRTTGGGDPLPGLQFGKAGVAWLLHDAGTWLADPALAAHGTALAGRLPLAWPNADVTHGSAGAGLLHLHLLQATGEDRFADRLRTCVDGLVAQAQRDAGQVLWRVPADFDSALSGKAFHGFAHGGAGIGWLLLAAAAACDRPDWRELAGEVGDGLCRVAVRQEGSAMWASGPDDDGAGLAEVWCNGSSGVGTFLIRLWRATGEDRFRELAHEAARAVWALRRYGSPAFCHGLAGNGDFLLDMADITGDATYHTWAEDLGDAIAAQYVRRGRRYLVPDESRTAVTADYGVGLAGTLAFLLRLRHGTGRMWMADPAAQSVVSAR